MKNILYLNHCLRLNAPDRKYYIGNGMRIEDLYSQVYGSAPSQQQVDNYTQNVKLANGKALIDSSPDEVTQYLKMEPAYQQKQTADFNTAQAGKEKDFLDRFKAAIGGQESLTDMATRIGGDLNLPNLRQSAFDLTASLKATPDVQKQATRGYNVNANQLARIISSKQAELAPKAQEATSQQQFAENQLGERLGYGIQEQQKELVPFQTESQMLGDRLAREFTGYTQDKQNALQMYMQQLANGQQLKLAEIQQANQLAQMKYQFDNTKAQTDRYLSGTSFYDTQTGQWNTAPKTSALKADPY